MLRYRGLALHHGKHVLAPVWVTGTPGCSAGAYVVAQMAAGAAAGVTIPRWGVGRGERCLREGAARVLPRAAAQTAYQRDGERLADGQDCGLHWTCPAYERWTGKGWVSRVPAEPVWAQEHSQSHQPGLLHPAQQGPAAAQGSRGGCPSLRALAKVTGRLLAPGKGRLSFLYCNFCPCLHSLRMRLLQEKLKAK